MTNYEFADVVLVLFPQSGLPNPKKRPGIILLDIGDADLVVAPVTSRARTQSGDVPISDLGGTGLALSSWVRLAKVSTLLKSDVQRKLGRLGAADRATIKREWDGLYGGFVS
jgi:mRNA interferase MazF